MPIEQQEFKKEGWSVETEERSEVIKQFLLDRDVSKYDPLSDLHFSGANQNVFENIKTGIAIISEINVFYIKDVPQKIHVVFDAEGNGQNVDCYFEGQALDDLLAFKTS